MLLIVLTYQICCFKWPPFVNPKKLFLKLIVKIKIC